MDKPTKTIQCVEQFYLFSPTLGEVLKNIPDGIDPDQVRFDVDTHLQILVSYVVYKDNSNYEADMRDYEIWRYKRIAQLETELKKLNPGPGRLPDDND